MTTRDLTIGEAAEAMGLSIDTLRFYEKQGLFPAVARRGGQRRYDADALEWIEFVAHLRASGMPVADLRRLRIFALQGDATLRERRKLVLDHRTALERQIARLHDALDLVDRKLAYYDTHLAAKSKPEQVQA